MLTREEQSMVGFLRKIFDKTFSLMLVLIFSSTIVDWAGGLSIASYGFDKTGASIDIHVTYLSTANINDIVEIEGAAAKVGKSIAFTTVKITKLVNGLPGPTVALGSHTKAGSFLM
jgi:acyl-coenzyme A thioesterase PaaI-like protein